MGVRPDGHPRAVGIFSVGIAPCGLASGIVGLAPQAGACSPYRIRRNSNAVPPINATTREKPAEKLTLMSPVWCGVVVWRHR